METLCSSCKNSIWCSTWSEWKCMIKGRRIYGEVAVCPSYLKRDKSFKERKCQCDDCLKNEELWEEE